MNNKERELIKEEIIKRCNAGIVCFTIIDVILIFFLLIALTINIGAIVCVLIFIFMVSFLIVFFSKAKKEPLNYMKYFTNLQIYKQINIQNSSSKQEYKYDKEYGFISNIFNQKISVSATNVSDEYIKKCINFIQNLDEEQMNFLVTKSINYYNEFKNMTNYEYELKMPETINDKKILNYIYPSVMWIGNDNKDAINEIEFLIEGSCEWNPDGIEIVVANNKIIHIGQYDGDIDYWKKKEI